MNTTYSVHWRAIFGDGLPTTTSQDWVGLLEVLGEGSTPYRLYEYYSLFLFLPVHLEDCVFPENSLIDTFAQRLVAGVRFRQKARVILPKSQGEDLLWPWSPVLLFQYHVFPKLKPLAPWCLEWRLKFQRSDITNSTEVSGSFFQNPLWTYKASEKTVFKGSWVAVMESNDHFINSGLMQNCDFWITPWGIWEMYSSVGVQHSFSRAQK